MGAELDLLGIGQISLDRVGRVERLPRRGEKCSLESEHQLPGGQIATALLAAARLGASARFVGAVGDDPAADLALAPLVAAGIDTRDVQRVVGAPTRQAWVLVERASGERTILERRAEALALPIPPLDPAVVAGARLLLLDTQHLEAAHWAADVARSAGVPVLLDADRPSDGVLALLRKVDFPIVSLGFAEEFSSDASLVETLRALSGTATRMAVITRGARGSLAWIGDRVIQTPAPPIDVVDTTGAGDVFRAAFACALLAGRDEERALDEANVAGALSCRALGAQGALPTRDEVDARLS